MKVASSIQGLHPVISTFHIQRSLNIQNWLICFPSFLLIFACLQDEHVLEDVNIDKHMVIFLYISCDVFDTGLFCVYEIFLTIPECINYTRNKIRNINLTI